MLRNMSTALFEREKIRTTLAKAKELRPFAEKLVTLSKRETLHARRLVLRHIKDPKVVTKLFDSLSARYAQRPGGYTRIIKLGPRRGDHAEMAILELVGAEDVKSADATEVAEKKAKKVGKKKTTRKKAAPKASAGEGDETRPKAKKKATKKKQTAKAAESKSSKKSATKKKAATTKVSKKVGSGKKD
jgi:large subunit ribosomal protein L17